MRLLIAMLVTGTIAAAPAALAKKSSSDKEGTDAVIANIIDVVKAGKPTEQELQDQKTRRRTRIEQLLTDLVAKGQITEQDKQKALDALSQHETHGVPPAVKDGLQMQFDTKSFCNDTIYRVLKDHLDQKDLNNILKFLKTPTGTKLIKETPDMVSEVVELAAAKFMPTFLDMAKKFRNSPGMMMPPGLMTPSPEMRQKQKEMMDKLKDLMQPKPNPQEET